MTDKVSHLTDDAERVAQKRYYHKDTTNGTIEDWAALSDRVVNHVCSKESDNFKKKIRSLIYNTKFLPNSPCLVNAGRQSKTKGLMACFVSKSPEDTWVGMVENIANFGHIARQGGGAGMSLSKIRPEGDPVFGSTHAKACGPIEHMRMVSEVMSSITQSGFRGMACLATMAVNHPDIEQFIVCKQHDRALKTLLKEDIFGHYDQMRESNSEELHMILDKFISNFNISVMATDEFMQKVSKDENIELKFKDKVYKTIKAKDVFDMIVLNAWHNGDPGLLFYDAINDSPYKYSGQDIRATNPCFHGDSMVAVADGRGFVSIKQLAEEKIDIPVYCCDPETGNIHIKYGRNPRKTRNNAPLCKVTFHDEGEITTTPDHKVLLRNGEYKEVSKLISGDSVMSMTKFEYISHRSKYIGVVKGDGQSTKPEHRMIYELYNGYLSEDNIIHHKDFNGSNNCIDNLQKACESCGESFTRKSFLANKLIYCSFECGNGDDINRAEIIDSAIRFVEQCHTYPTVSTWNNYESAVCSREKVRKEFKNFQALSEELIDMGVFADLTKNTKVSSKMISAAIVNWTIKNGKEPSRKNVIQDICSEQAVGSKGGFKSLLQQAHQLCEAHAVNHKVVSVEMLEETDDVYNITVDDFHNLCILTKTVHKSPSLKYSKKTKPVSRYTTVVYKNCGEQTLPEYGSCNLGSIDVSKFYDAKDNDVDWPSLKDAIRTSMQFLDDIIDANTFPTPEFSKWARHNRPVGLGIMGLSDLLLKMKLTYGGVTSLNFAEKLIEFFKTEAHKKSVELGKERGTPKCCRYDELDHRRNITILSIAPTGSISTLAACSSSIEPIFSSVTYRNDNTGSYVIDHPEADKKYFRCALDQSEDKSKELPWKSHIDMQAVFQKHVDASISKTINMPNNATTQDVADAYMMAWSKKCKGITIYRDGCKSTQVLNTQPKKSKFRSDHAPKRPKELPCDIYNTKAQGFEWHILVGKYDNKPYELFAVNGRTSLPDYGTIVKKKNRHYSLFNKEGECVIDNLVQEESNIDPKVTLETRRFSLELRHGIPPKYIVQQIDKSNEALSSFSKATSRIFKNKILTDEDYISIAGDIACPECKKEDRIVSLIPDSGCWKCPSCHFARCG